MVARSRQLLIFLCQHYFAWFFPYSCLVTRCMRVSVHSRRDSSFHQMIIILLTSSGQASLGSCSCCLARQSCRISASACFPIDFSGHYKLPYTWHSFFVLLVRTFLPKPTHNLWPGINRLTTLVISRYAADDVVLLFPLH